MRSARRQKVKELRHRTERPGDVGVATVLSYNGTFRQDRSEVCRCRQRKFNAVCGTSSGVQTICYEVTSPRTDNRGNRVFAAYERTICAVTNAMKGACNDNENVRENE